MTLVKPTPLSLFRRGYDTAEIASYFGISEASAHKTLTLQRSESLDKPNPYPVISKPWPQPSMAYAGQ